MDETEGQENTEEQLGILRNVETILFSNLPPRLLINQHPLS